MVFRRDGECGIEVPDDARDWHVENSSARLPLGRISCCRRLRLSELRVVHVGSGAAKLQTPDSRAPDPVIHVVEERHQDRGVEQRVLELSVEGLPRGRTGLAASFLEDQVGLGRGEIASRRTAAGVEEGESEIVRIVVVGDPAAEHDIDVLVRVPRLEELGHGRRHDVDLHTQIGPDPEEGLRQRGVLVQQDRVHGDPDLDGQRKSGGPDHLDRFFAREVRLPPSGVVSENPGRDHTRRGQGEPPERPPDEVLGSDGACEREPQSGARSGGGPGVEDGEIGVLLGSLLFLRLVHLVNREQ